MKLIVTTINKIEFKILPEIKLRIKDKIVMINPNKNIRGKIVLKNLLLALVLNVAKTEGETTAIKKIIDPIRIVTKKIRV